LRAIKYNYTNRVSQSSGHKLDKENKLYMLAVTGVNRKQSTGGLKPQT
jgi:hypothetical protein